MPAFVDCTLSRNYYTQSGVLPNYKVWTITQQEFDTESSRKYPPYALPRNSIFWNITVTLTFMKHIRDFPINCVVLSQHDKERASFECTVLPAL